MNEDIIKESDKIFKSIVRIHKANLLLVKTTIDKLIAEVINRKWGKCPLNNDNAANFLRELQKHIQSNMQNTNIPHVVKNIELLISKNVIKVIAEKYLVVMSDSLWKQFNDKQKQTTAMRNLSLYCQLKNAHSGSEVQKQKLQLFIKNANHKVIALYELHDDKIMKKELEPLLSE